MTASLTFLLGVLLGTFFGVGIMALLAIGRDPMDDMEPPKVDPVIYGICMHGVDSECWACKMPLNAAKQASTTKTKAG